MALTSFRNDHSSLSFPHWKTFLWPLSQIPLVRTVTCEPVSLLHGAVYVTVSLMKPGPGGAANGGLIAAGPEGWG